MLRPPGLKSDNITYPIPPSTMFIIANPRFMISLMNVVSLYKKYVSSLFFILFLFFFSFQIPVYNPPSAEGHLDLYSLPFSKIVCLSKEMQQISHCRICANVILLINISKKIFFLNCNTCILMVENPTPPFYS